MGPLILGNPYLGLQGKRLLRRWLLVHAFAASAAAVVAAGLPRLPAQGKANMAFDVRGLLACLLPDAACLLLGLKKCSFNSPDSNVNQAFDNLPPVHICIQVYVHTHLAIV